MLDDLADLLLGARCPGCGRPGLGVCTACRAALDVTPSWVRDAPALGGLRVASAGRYEHPLDQLLSAHKDRGALSLTPLLARRLALAVTLLQDACGAGVSVVLVPVPSSPAAVRARGFDHAGALARRSARCLGRAGVSAGVAPVLRRSSRVVDQAGLTRAQRARNQSRSMVARPPRQRGAPVLLVDDICTTGASLSEASRALRAAGWAVLGGAVVAHPTRPGESSRPRGLKSL